MEKNTDQPPRIMHHCKVCNKGFSCGGALGGHMRAHGVEDVNSRNDEEGNNKRAYFLRTTTNRFVSGNRARGDRDQDSDKSFLTLNSHFQQGKCSLDEPLDPTVSFRHARVPKKYDKSSCASREERDLANCLVMLSNGEEDRAKEGRKGIFQCNGCKKVFNSHQALGGHRASHKKVKGCYANDEHLIIVTPKESDGIDFNPRSETPLIFDSKMESEKHKCSVCHRIFSSGQALGGHKRCHWLMSTIPNDNAAPMLHGFRYDRERLFKKPTTGKTEPLDLSLNFPRLHDYTDKENGGKTRIYLPPRDEEENDGVPKSSHGSLVDGSREENCEVKVAKQSEMRGMNLDGKFSTWLQVGIAPATQ